MERMKTPGIGMMAVHADAIAQDRAAGVRAGGVDRDDADCCAFRP